MERCCYISESILPEPYSSVLIDIERSLFEMVELAKRGLERVYRVIKNRIDSLTKDFTNPVYINAKNIISAVLFYIFLSEGC